MHGPALCPSVLSQGSFDALERTKVIHFALAQVSPRVYLTRGRERARGVETSRQLEQVSGQASAQSSRLDRNSGKAALEILTALKDAGLDGLPGAGGEILEDEVRLQAAPGRIHASDWFRIIDIAQSLQLYTISTMVIGFGETMTQRVSHLLKLRDQQDKALGEYNNAFYGFAMWTLQTENTRLHGKAPGASAHEYLQNLAVSRIALDNIPNIQVSWPTLGFKVGQVGLFYGANDFGSTMMEENVVSQAAGHDRVRVTEREIIRNIADAGFRAAQRDSRFKILRYPDPHAILEAETGVSRASEEQTMAGLENPNELEAVNAAAR